jgi:dTDP-glucose 4,6-dehydratase
LFYQKGIFALRIVITGGAGFIGSHLTDRFLSEGHRVVAVDNLLTGKYENIAHHAANPNFEFIHHDVSNHIYINGDVDIVMHFASPASPIDYLKFPIQTLKVGAMGTHNALGLARIKNARFMIASTSEIYGDPLEHPQKESYVGNVDSIGPRGVYDEAKRYAEALTMAYHREHGMETRIVRIFNTYGPRMRLDDGRVVPNFVGQALRNEPLTVYGNGSQTRCFQYVSDLIEGLHHQLILAQSKKSPFFNLLRQSIKFLKILPASSIKKDFVSKVTHKYAVQILLVLVRY